MKQVIVNITLHGILYLHLYVYHAKCTYIQERLDLEGITYRPALRMFERVTRGLLDCVYLCDQTYGCIGVSYDESLRRCIGCKCGIVRYAFNQQAQAGSKFYLQVVLSLFNGRCGVVDFESITGEYYPNGPSIGTVTPPIKLHSQQSWAPANIESYTLKVDFGFKRLVYGVKLQGRKPEQGGVKEYVTKYAVYHSDVPCDTTHEIGVYEGYNNFYQVKISTFDTPVLTQCIVLRPMEWYNRPSVRIDIFGY